MALAGRNGARGEVGGGGEVRGEGWEEGSDWGGRQESLCWACLALSAWISRVVSKGRFCGDLDGEDVAEGEEVSVSLASSHQ